MFTLVGNGVFWVVPVVIIAARELVISVYRSVAGAKGVSMPASRMAKYKTLCQQLAVGFALMPLTALDATWLWNGFLWVAVVLAVVSGWQYFARARDRRARGRAACGVTLRRRRHRAAARPDRRHATRPGSASSWLRSGSPPTST